MEDPILERVVAIRSGHSVFRAAEENDRYQGFPEKDVNHIDAALSEIGVK